MNRIKELRLSTLVNEKILTQGELGAMIGRDQSLISKLEKGNIDFDMSMADKLAEIFGVQIEDLRTISKNITLPPKVVSGRDSFQLGRDIPIYDYTRNSNGSIMLEKKISMTPAHPGQEGYQDCFVIEADGQMRPRYRDMEKIYVVRNKRPQIGKDCFVEMRNGEWFIKQFMETTSKEIICRDLNIDKEWRKPLTEVQSLHEIRGRD